MYRRLAGPKAVEMVAYVITRVVRARSEFKTVLDEKMLDKGTGAKVLAVALIGAKVVTGHANLAVNALAPYECVRLDKLRDPRLTKSVWKKLQ